MGTSQSREVTPRVVTPKSISRTSSGANIQEKSQFASLDKLAKYLGQKSAEETNTNGQGISSKVFAKFLFSSYPELSEHLYKYFVTVGSAKQNSILTLSVFKQQGEKLMTLINDSDVTELYIRVYSLNDELTRDQFKALLQQAYQLAMDFYPDGPTRTCVHLLKILKAVVDSAFHRKEIVSVSFLSHWVQANCSRLLLGLHRYVVHTLSTSYQHIGKTEQDSPSSGLELTTPVLERELKFEQDENVMLPLSEVWLLATSLPEVFTRPSEHHTPCTSYFSMSANYFISKLIGSVCPSHWTMLYNSTDQGLAANRFSYHVLSYRGPTLTLIRGQEGVQFCIGSATEWRDTHVYWGDENSIIIQILPLYHIIDRGPKMLYFNSSIRGYPKGIRAGNDKKAPCLQVDEGFGRLTFCGIPYMIGSIEVWGCGTVQDRNIQQDVKKWQVKQAEQARQVKLNPSDWVNNPDRYLLELAGRPSYAST